MLASALTGLAGTGFVALALHQNGLALGDVDMDGDGRTTLGEALRALETGVRSVQRDGEDCRELYSLKDGRPIRTLYP
ncbi:MAG: hypothetical protein AAF566_08030 [Pseudomonadota bacterium]